MVALCMSISAALSRKLSRKSNGSTLQGKWSFKVGPTSMTYEGDYILSKQNKDKIKQGTGVLKWDDGREYTGKFSNDKMHGQGTMTWPNGEVYVGQYSNDNKEGAGKWTLPDGSSFEGQWQDGKRYGEFLNFDSEGNAFRVRYEADQVMEILEDIPGGTEAQTKSGHQKSAVNAARKNLQVGNTEEFGQAPRAPSQDPGPCPPPQTDAPESQPSRQQRISYQSHHARTAIMDEGEPPLVIDGYTLKPADVTKFREAFSLFDSDNSGSITAEELGTVLRSMGLFPSDDDCKVMVAELDNDNTGSIAFDEFLHLMVAQLKEQEKQKEQHDLVEEFVLAFKALDSDGNGYVDAAELRHKMQNHGSMRLSDEECDEMLREADINGDGKLDYEEFVRMMLSPVDAEEEEAAKESRNASKQENAKDLS